MKIIQNALIRWLPLAAAITILAGAIYATVQQAYRANANDPQIQMAQDATRAMDAGEWPEELLPERQGAQIDIAASLAPYWAIYDDVGELMGSDAVLDGLPPELPKGVFEYARQHGEDRITWEPAEGVRSAIVVVHGEGRLGGFVMFGRSLREVEERVNQLAALVGIGWIIALATTFALTLGLELLARIQSAP